MKIRQQIQKKNLNVVMYLQENIIVSKNNNRQYKKHVITDRFGPPPPVQPV
jgi:hypothetical protein